jgi:phosphoserine phosphatase RsbU/P
MDEYSCPMRLCIWSGLRQSAWRKRSVVLVAIISLALPVWAQVFDMERDRVQMASLSGLMRFHTGDDADGKLGWARADFDDSTWPLISSDKDWSSQGYKGLSGFAWYRFKVVVPDDRKQLALYIPQIRTSYQVFADGKLVGSFGGFPPKATVYAIRRHVVLLAPEHGSQMEIAIRVWHWPQWAMYFGGGMTNAPRIGDNDVLNDWKSVQDKASFWDLLAQNCSALLNLLYGCAGLALFLMRRKEREYLWYGLSGIFFGSVFLVNDYATFHDVAELVSDPSTDMLAAAGFFSFFLFVWMMMGGRRTVWVWLTVASLCLHAGMWIVLATTNLPIATGNILLLLIDTPISVGPVVLLAQGVKRGDPEARFLLIPVGLNTLANWIGNVLVVILTAGYTWIIPLWTLWNRTFDWPFPFSLYDLSIWILLLAIVAIVVVRFARSRQEEDQYKSELEAARAVQQLLIPEKMPEVPSFRIESAYRPSRQVGGDFFYIRPESEQCVLLVVGDVSGKGLKAAMTVNLMVGALRTLPTLTPGQILAALNQGLMGQMQQGFVTCCAVRIARDGAVIIANAGHLPPYLDGIEVPVAPGLPLGITSGLVYEETALQLNPDSSLTLVTDGVVEARNAKGELFGFERTVAISDASADEIATAAEQFGQDDDITVLKITRLADAPSSG